MATRQTGAMASVGIPSYTTELRGTSGGFFPPFSDVATLYNENKGMLVYMAKIARTPYLTTRGPDADSLPTTLTVSVLGSVQAERQGQLQLDGQLLPAKRGRR